MSNIKARQKITETAQHSIAELEAQLQDAKERPPLREAIHDLRNSIASLKLSLQILQRNDDEIDTERLDMMDHSLSRAIDLIQHISKLQKQAHTDGITT